MNGQERFEAALKCEEVDKMPTHWMAVEPAGKFRVELDAYLDIDENPEIEECFEISKLGDITMKNWFSRGTTTDMGIGAGGINFQKAYYNEDTDHFYTKEEAKSLPASKKNVTIDMFGSVRKHGYKMGKPGERASDYWWYLKPYFSGYDAIERWEEYHNEFGAPWEEVFDSGASSIKNAKNNIKLAQESGFPHAVSGSTLFHFEGIWGGFGPMTIAKLARKKPSLLRDICKKYETLTLTVEKYSLEAGHTIIGTGDDLGQKGRSLISPKLYKEFFQPALKSRCDLAHKYGAVIWMHSCGFIEELVDNFLEAGLDGLQSLEVPAGNDLARIRAKVRDKMCLIGGIDSSRFMSFGTADECRAHTKEQMEKATTLDGETMNGGYIPGPAHDLIDVKLENVQAVIETIAKYGKYPLKF